MSGRRDSFHRHPIAHGGHHGRGGWRSRQSKTEQQAAALRNFKSASAEVGGGRSTSQEEVKKQRFVEDFTHGRFGRFSSHRPPMAEQTSAFVAVIGRGYRGMERGAPFGDLGPAHKKEWMQQRSESLRAAHAVMVAVTVGEAAPTTHDTKKHRTSRNHTSIRFVRDVMQTTGM
ncbi:hypothetical protein PR002_g22056 [Phytophthora rubi]|uniref:Uncharacterized protein n=1 Tax=Phytophthora rubi TaxID=129364 RepID=A0A6A3IZE9_9STRA|nr:hypothetical protein PR002_g22056 [Phytophthora rubi]